MESKQTVAVVTDSVAQVPEDIARQLNITIIPFSVNFGEKTYLDGVDLDPQELYRRMRTEKVTPTTAAPSAGQYLEIFRSVLEKGWQEVLCISLAAKLSSGYNTALSTARQLCQEYPGRLIEVVDSRKATISQGFVAIAAARAAMQGKSFAEVKQTASEASRRSGFAASLDTLEYLARGGRIGKAAYMVGSLMDIKPILALDQEGLVSPIKIVRSKNHALNDIVNYVENQVRGYRKLNLAIMQADAHQQAAQLQEIALQKLNPTELFVSEFTPVMGVHTGPGLVGLAYYYE
jgi:DegV family protein with EDD domain